MPLSTLSYIAYPPPITTGPEGTRQPGHLTLGHPGGSEELWASDALLVWSSTDEEKAIEV